MRCGVGGISSTCIGAAHLLHTSTRTRSPPDAGMKARQQAEKIENENGFTKLKPSPATEAPAHLGESRARDERSRHAQSRAYKSKRFSRASSRWGGEGRRPPSPFCFFFFAKSVTFRGVFLINVICVIKKARYHPLMDVTPRRE